MNLFKKLFRKSNDDYVQPEKKTIDIDELLTAENQNNSIIALDDYICGLCIYGDDLSHLSEVQLNFYYIQELEREVNNGGFNQYFFNSAGDYAHETIIALNAIAAKRTATILQQAIDEFPDQSVAKYRSARQHILEQIEEQSDPVWEELNQQFFNYEDNLNSLNIQYIKANRNRF